MNIKAIIVLLLGLSFPAFSSPIHTRTICLSLDGLLDLDGKTILEAKLHTKINCLSGPLTQVNHVEHIKKIIVDGRSFHIWKVSAINNNEVFGYVVLDAMNNTTVLRELSGA